MRMSTSGPSGESNRPDLAEKASELENGIAEKGVKQMSIEDDEDDFAKLDMTQRKFKAATIRKEAVDLDGAAVALHEQAFAMEKRAAKLRIRAWKLEGAVSAVSKEVIDQNVKDKHEKTLAELDLMAEDWSEDPVCMCGCITDFVHTTMHAAFLVLPFRCLCWYVFKNFNLEFACGLLMCRH